MSDSELDPGPDPPDLSGLRIALAGPGRVGTSLVHWARARGAAVELVAGRDAERRESVAEALGARAVPLRELASDACDLLLVAVPDPVLDGVARELALRPQASAALHTAGGRGASALEALAAAGSSAGSFHPLKAFPEPLTSLADAAGTFFALDGPPPAVALGRRLARAFGGTADVVPEELRPLYHLAASVAAGGVTTLVASTAGLARELGLPDAVGRGYLELAAGALARARSAVEKDGAMPETGRESAPERMARAITGPVARGEMETFASQMETLERAGSAGRRRVELFVRLALETSRLRSDLGGPGAGSGREGSAVEELETALRRRDLAVTRFLDPPDDEC